MLTARQSESDRVTGLEIGADDYLTKPFSVLELQARVKALPRRSNLHSASQGEDQKEPQEVICREVKILPLKRKAFVRGNEVQLTSKEFDLLLYLVKAPDRVFSREQLLNAVWGYDHSGYEHTVNSHINRLRSKIESDPSNPEYVHTVWGVGYKFSE
jgi:DNA-binding response OmpR family regulator